MVYSRSRTISKKRKRKPQWVSHPANPAPTYIMGKRRLNARSGGYLGLELKFLDCAWNGVALGASTDGSGGELQPSSGSTNCISCPAQGDGESNRDGRKYVIKSCFVSGNIDTTGLQDQANATDAAGFWFALVLDTQTNGATINSEDVYVNPSTSAIAMLPQPLRNLQNSKRFKILDSCFRNYKDIYAFNDGGATGAIIGGQLPTVKLSWKGTIQVETTGTAADVASVSDNSLHVVAYAGSTGFTPVFIGKSRVRFMG